MNIYEYGDRDAEIVLVQPVDRRDRAYIENEAEFIACGCKSRFRLIAAEVTEWNKALSPWDAPAVFGKEDFGSGAADTLANVLELCGDKSRKYFIGGYSLAGLFSLWASCRTDAFSAVCAASPSVWFPGFVDYMGSGRIMARAVYLSLGDREEKTRNPVTATVGDNIRRVFGMLRARGVNCVLEWNEGNHFKDAFPRTAKGFIWAINNYEAGTV